MVQLTLLHPKGNQGLKYWPHAGYLGLTPVKVEGGPYPNRLPSQISYLSSKVVRTKLDNDLKFLPSASITVGVRCYESRLGGFGTSHTNVLADYSQVLWSKPEDQEYVDVGNVEYSFHIVVPVTSPGFSTAVFKEYRVHWRLEASE
jgi:hypothetical protein